MEENIRRHGEVLQRNQKAWGGSPEEPEGMGSHGGEPQKAWGGSPEEPEGPSGSAPPLAAASVEVELDLLNFGDQRPR